MSKKKTKKDYSRIGVIAISLVICVGLVGIAGAYISKSPVVFEGATLNVEKFIQYEDGASENLLGGSTSDDWNVGGALSVTGASTLTGAVTMSGALSTSGNANVGNLTYGLTTVASSTSNSAETLLASYLSSYSGMDYTPSGDAVTLTLPATSTLTSVIPNVGECMDWRIRNTSATSASSTTIAAGTGMDLVENENGDVVIEGGNEAQIKFCRELDTDVTVYVDEYIAAD